MGTASTAGHALLQLCFCSADLCSVDDHHELPRAPCPESELVEVVTVSSGIELGQVTFLGFLSDKFLIQILRDGSLSKKNYLVSKYDSLFNATVGFMFAVILVL